MRIFSRLIKGVAVFSASALVLSACAGGTASKDGATSGESTPVAGAPQGEINLGVAYETTNYHPSNTTSALAMGTNWHVVEGLYEFDMATFKHYPALAAGEPTQVSDTEYEIALRDGAKFSDGSDVTAADVVSSFGRSTAEGVLYINFLDFIESITEKDAKTVTVKLKYAFPGVADRLVDVKIVPSAKTDEELTSMPIGSGPFKYESITDSLVTAVPNEHYNGPYPAKVAKMNWHVLKDDTARLNAAIGGTIDVMEAVPADTAEALTAKGWKVEEVLGHGNPFVMFNTQKAPYDKAELRQAFLKAIDKDTLVKEAMQGKAVAATSFLSESHPMYKKAATQFDFDTEAAKAKFAEHGLTEVKIITTDHPWVKNLAPQIKANLEAAGLKVSVESFASADVYANYADVEGPDRYDVIIAPGDPSVFGIDAAIIVNWWYGKNSWTEKRNAFALTDEAGFKELRALVDEAVTLEGDAAKAKWGEVQDKIAEKAPLYPLFHRKVITGYNEAKLDGFSAIGTTGLELVGVGVK